MQKIFSDYNDVWFQRKWQGLQLEHGESSNVRKYDQLNIGADDVGWCLMIMICGNDNMWYCSNFIITLVMMESIRIIINQ